MRTVRRVVALFAVSIVGIVLLAPLAARSAVDIASPVDDRLLDAAAAAAEPTSRGSLATREVVQLAAVSDGPEVIGEATIAAPTAVPMTATLVPRASSAPAPPSTPAVAPAPAPAGPTRGGSSVWDALAECESGGNWAINTGNGYYGGLQFSYATWHDFGGAEFAEYPHQATREGQIAVAERLHAARGFQPWPACRAKLGLP